VSKYSESLKYVGGGASPPNLVWTFPGTISTDQNANLARVKIKTATQITAWDVNLVGAPTGAALIVNFKVGGATVATVTVAAGDTFAESATPVTLAVDDVVYPEVSQVGSSTPGTTATMRGRAA